MAEIKKISELPAQTSFSQSGIKVPCVTPSGEAKSIDVKQMLGWVSMQGKVGRADESDIFLYSSPWVDYVQEWERLGLFENVGIQFFFKNTEDDRLWVCTCERFDNFGRKAYRFRATQTALGYFDFSMGTLTEIAPGEYEMVQS